MSSHPSSSSSYIFCRNCQWYIDVANEQQPAASQICAQCNEIDYYCNNCYVFVDKHLCPTCFQKSYSDNNNTINKKRPTTISLDHVRDSIKRRRRQEQINSISDDFPTDMADPGRLDEPLADGTPIQPPSPIDQHELLRTILHEQQKIRSAVETLQTSIPNLCCAIQAMDTDFRLAHTSINVLSLFENNALSQQRAASKIMKTFEDIFYTDNPCMWFEGEQPLLSCKFSDQSSSSTHSTSSRLVSKRHYRCQ